MTATPRPSPEPAVPLAPGRVGPVSAGSHRIAANATAPSRDAAARERASLRRRLALADFLASRQSAVLSLLAELLDEPSLDQALDAFAGALQRRFGAERVAVALAAEDGELRIATISQQANVDAASAEAQLLVAAMQEACELDRIVSLPATDEDIGVLEAHRTLAGRRANTMIATVPLFRTDAGVIGAVVLERRDADPFADTTLELLGQIALAAAPVIQARRDAERGSFERLRTQVRHWLGKHLGHRRPGARLMLTAVVLATVLLSLVPVQRHVVADAELVPRQRRLVTAPVDGFVDEVTIKAGERVAAGQLLGRLDRRELDLELARHDSEIASAEADFRAAMAAHDRQATAIARARLERERALKALVEQRLERGELRAPIEGLIISGDPGDATGMPVQRGETLFEIAPDDGYEVHLLVDERDAHRLQEGQVGTLALRARPDDPVSLRVVAVHPVAESGDGASRLRVRATLDEGHAAARPGQSGIAHLEAGRTTLGGRLVAPVRRALDELRWRLSR